MTETTTVETLDLVEFAQQTAAFDTLMQERDNADAYMRITQEMGPSPQLFAFVTNGAKLQTDDGVGLESLDLATQHDFLMSKLSVDVLDNMAMENLADRVRKISKYAISGGAVAWVAGTFLTGGMLGPLGLLAVVGGAISMKVSGKATQTYKYETFKHYTAEFDKLLAHDVAMANAMPTAFTASAWKSFFDKYSKKEPTPTETKKDKAPFDKSGWTEANFTDAAKWFKANTEKLEGLQKTFGKKMAGVGAWLEKDHGEDADNASVLKYISGSVGLSSKLFNGSSIILRNIDTILSAVANRFEESKKD